MVRMTYFAGLSGDTLLDFFQFQLMNPRAIQPFPFVRLRTPFGGYTSLEAFPFQMVQAPDDVIAALDKLADG